MLKLTCNTPDKKIVETHHYLLESDGPVSLEHQEHSHAHPSSPHVLAHVYSEASPDEYSEPVGAYDSEVSPKINWEATHPSESQSEAIFRLEGKTTSDKTRTIHLHSTQPILAEVTVRVGKNTTVKVFDLHNTKNILGVFDSSEEQ